MNSKYNGYSFPINDTVIRQKVSFCNRYGIMLEGDLDLPKVMPKQLAAVAIAGPFGAVKEQCAGLYAEDLASRGFAALAFDPSFIGESGGEVRNEHPPISIQKIFRLLLIFCLPEISYIPNRLRFWESVVGVAWH